ncbi:MAG: serine/threonine-protein kinase, partial [Byssovorax sp.]
RVVDADVSPELGDVPILVMELLDGRDLGTELKRRGAIPAGEVVLYLRQVARALDKAHGLGIIHRDLKPANLYLTQRDDGTPLVKILDFGIAKLADGVSGELTQDGTIFGTPWYMSPEQARGQASKVGPSIDLWALGLIAFRLLTGRNYWTAEGMAALIGQIVYDPMPPPSQMAPHLGPRFDEWFARACNREVEHRFTSASEEVKQLAEALGVSVGPQHTGQLDVSQFPANAGYGPAPGISAAGLSMPGGLSQSGGKLSQSAGGASQPSGGVSQAGGGLSQSGGGLSQSGGGLSQSGGALGSSSAPSSASAGLSSTGAPLSQSGSTSAPFSATNAPMAAKTSNLVSIAMGVLIAVLMAGGAMAGWVLLGPKASPPTPVVATTAAPTAEPSAVPTAEPTATAAIAAPAPSASAEAPAEAPASAAIPPVAAPSSSAAASASPTAVAAAGAVKSPVAATTPTPKSPTAPTGVKQAPKNAPKVDKIKF